MNQLLAPWLERFDQSGLHAPVVVGSSGGADSTATLALAAAIGLEPVAVHVDHGLRVGSGEEAGRVHEIARTVGADVQCVQVEIAPGSGLEARARAARHRALADAAQRVGAESVLIGHTMDDLAETVLLNVLRGAGSDGLAGIAHPLPGTAHPILGLRRAETIEICRRLGITPIDDPMNELHQYRRVWVRRELLPRLATTAARDLVPVLARQARVLRDESRYLDHVAHDAWPVDGVAAVAVLQALPLAVARRALRSWLGFPAPSSDELDSVFDVVDGRRRAVQLAGGRRVTRTAGVLDVARAVVGLRPFEWELPSRVRADVWQLDARVEHGTPVVWPDGTTVCVRDADRLGTRVVVRAPVRGERIEVHGGGSRDVAGLLVRHGIAPRRHASVPVVADVVSGAVVWIPGVRVGRFAAVDHRTRRFAWLSVEALDRPEPGTTVSATATSDEVVL